MVMGQVIKLMVITIEYRTTLHVREEDNDDDIVRT